MNRTAAATLAAACLAGLSGCATIVRGTSQEISFASNPPGATIKIADAQYGVTPASVRIPRRRDVGVTLEAPGYAPVTRPLNRKLNPWFWGNLLVGGWGMLIDFIDGAMWTLYPDTVAHDFTRGAPGAAAAPVFAGATGLKSPLAVAAFDAQGVSANDAAIIADLFRSELIRGGAFEVIEKSNMDKVLQEQAFQQTGCTTQECAVKLGRVLNVKYLVVGTFGKLMGEHVVNVRVIEVETARAVYSDDARGLKSQAEVAAALGALARRLTGAVGGPR